jgi:tyrosinase
MAEDQPQTPPQPSRYQRVKDYLNQAAGDGHPSYQGYGRFWELPLPEFLNVVIYGIRMIVPAEASSGSPAPAPSKPGACCHAAPDAPAATPPPQSSCSSHKRARYPGRGAGSGLIIGLRGQCPFDGTQFPRLPWDGNTMSDADIQFISDWIDDGCPGDDEPHHHVSVHEHHSAARARGDEAHPLHKGNLNSFRSDSGGVKVRKNVEYLTPEELARFRAAIAHMKSYDAFYQDERSFGYWARIHANNCQHGWEEFLTWHRVYLYEFELQLQDVDPSVTLPYWDWTMYSADVQASITDMGTDVVTDNGVIPAAYQCWMDDAALKRLQGVIPDSTIAQLRAIKDQKYNSGLRLFAAAHIKYGQDKSTDTAIMNQLAIVNPLWDQFRWPGGNSNLIFEAYPTPEDVDRIMQLTSFFSFGSGPTDNHFFGALENIHNLIHNFSGGVNPNYVKGTQPENRIEPQAGDMVYPGMTAYDPIFWGHHSNVDRLWHDWQTLHPGANPDNPTSILPPWTLTVGETYDIAKFGYEYMKSSHVFPTDSGTPITKFKSDNAEVHPDVLSNHRRAEVRLHKVRYVTRGGYHIRVFLNSPDADVNTPTRGNPNYVGLLNMFTGFCVGGPGHCDEPKERSRKFDKRARPHKTPGHFRIDATETVQKLAAKGETDLRVNLVVMNTDGTPATDALRLDAVSLNFID